MRFLLRLLCSIPLTVSAVLAPADRSFADTRVALVIGNGAYQNAPRLLNPANDAAGVAAALRRAGFDTTLATDLTKSGMDEATIRFARSARTADVAMFYYSGHALQFAGTNYLAPVDLDLRDETDLRRMTRVDEVVADLAQARSLRILVLDSCRDNPLADQLKRAIGASRALPLQRGLARIDSPEGMIVAYATQAGRTANDGVGKNSPYTAAFLKHIDEKEEIGSIFRRISADVYEATRHQQLPELSLSFIGEFYLHGKLETSGTSPPPDPCAAAADHWKSAEAIATKEAFEDHLARFPGCAFAGLARARIDALKSKTIAALPGERQTFGSVFCGKDPDFRVLCTLSTNAPSAREAEAGAQDGCVNSSYPLHNCTQVGTPFSGKCRSIYVTSDQQDIYSQDGPTADDASKLAERFCNTNNSGAACRLVAGACDGAAATASQIHTK